MWLKIHAVFLIIRLSHCLSLEFSEDFLFGVSTSAYQIEGGYNLNGKGENIWDYYTRTNPSMIQDFSNGNIAADSYHKYKEDINLIKFLGVDFYRFSISWSRLLPNGFADKINPDGILYYNNLINGLKEIGVEPMVTLYHFDLPKPLQNLGGWTNPKMVDYFRDYANVTFQNFGDRVKYWVTFNAACEGYVDNAATPPFTKNGAESYYLCVSTIVKSHAAVYHLYQENYKMQNGKIGITIDAKWFEPVSDKEEDMEAAERMREFVTGFFAEPLIKGDYPELLKKRIEKHSLEEGFLKSRLPLLEPKEKEYLKGTVDFLGLNMYTTFKVRSKDSKKEEPSLEKDLGVALSQDPNWPSAKSKWLKVAPWSFRKILKWLKDKYDPEIIVTENGYSDEGQLEDTERTNYLESHLKVLLQSINKDQVNIKGYAIWSLLDNFEWLAGYTEKFGLFHVDFNDEQRKRTPKSSAIWYKNLINNRNLKSLNVKAEL